MNKQISRRTILSGIAPALALAVSQAKLGSPAVHQWDIFEQAFPGPVNGNPFADVTFQAEFRHGNRVLLADGFYDGNGIYRLRLMPDAPGDWTFVTHSSAAELDGKRGSFVCVAPTKDNHGPVHVRDSRQFCYADGTPHISFGTTCYAWAHQTDELEATTLRTLKTSPFNKLRMCVLPTETSPLRVPFERDGTGEYDPSRFNTAFFQHLEQRIGDLRALDIEADLILFHPYDHEGFQSMSAQQSQRYLRYVIARCAAYRNVWWSMANEFDLVKNKNLPDWDDLFRVLQEADPSAHLRSIHYSKRFYDYSKTWITHLSLQSDDFSKTSDWFSEFNKPIVFDECKYEGNISKRWGNLSGQEMARRFWLGMTSGAYVGHGETYGANGSSWLSKGGNLLGESPARIAFLKNIWQEAPPDLSAIAEPYYLFVFKAATYYLYFLDLHQPAEYEFKFPETETYKADIIDIWDMTISPVSGTFHGTFALPLPGKPFQAIRFQRSNT